MTIDARMPTAADLAQNAIEKRAYAEREFLSAQGAGAKDDARAWKKQMREWDKLIARYGLAAQ